MKKIDRNHWSESGYTSMPVYPGLKKVDISTHQELTKVKVLILNEDDIIEYAMYVTN